MMHPVHRTIPFIAIAALVTVSSAGAQERDDSTSTASAVVSLLGLGGNFVGFGAAGDAAPQPMAWNCAGGCAARKSGGLGFAPFGGLGSTLRSSPRVASAFDARRVRPSAEHADLSDYGWSRRVGTDGAPLDRLTPITEPWLPAPAPVRDDGAGRAPSWVAPGSSRAAARSPWRNESSAPFASDVATGAAGRTTPPPATAPNEPITALAEAFEAAPLVTTVPEPSTLVLLAVGLSSLVAVRRRGTRTR